MIPADSDRAVSRRNVAKAALGCFGLGGFASARSTQERLEREAPIRAKDNLRITRVETIMVKPAWCFLKIHTNAGVVGLGEPVLEGRAATVAQAVKEVESYLVGQDPRPVVHHWQAIYRHAFYRGGPILTSALSGIDQALWDIKGKALGVPVYELLGGPTRTRIRPYVHVYRPNMVKPALERGYTVLKAYPPRKRPFRYVDTPAAIQHVAEQFAEMRRIAGDDIDIGVDFHGVPSPANAKLLIKALEPYQPMFVEEPCPAQNHDMMAEIARGTHLPIATGERIFTKWGFLEVLEKRAATILQPDLCHAGGITEVRVIASMAEAYYASIAPHNPLGPISLASCIQLGASIPNYLVQEQGNLGVGYLKKPFEVRNGFIELPTGPGLGIELDENALADKIADHDFKLPRTYDPEDGSVRDW